MSADTHDTPESVAARLRHYDQLDMPLYHEAAALIEAQAAEIARLSAVEADLDMVSRELAVRTEEFVAMEARATHAEAERDAAFKMRGFWEERYYAALSASEKDRQRMREALEQIATLPPGAVGHAGALARAALSTDATQEVAS